MVEYPAAGVARRYGADAGLHPDDADLVILPFETAPVELVRAALSAGYIKLSK